MGVNLNLRHWFELLLCFNTSSAATEHKGDQTVTRTGRNDNSREALHSNIVMSPIVHFIVLEFSYFVAGLYIY